MAALVRIFFLSVMVFGQPAFSETYTRREVVPAEFFGWIIHRAHTVTPWPTVPFGSWRLWDSYAKWSDIESEPGIFNFDNLDKQVALGAARNKELTYTFGQTPRWASSQPDSKHAWGLGAGSMPKDLEVWRRYVEATSNRFKGKIAFYEVWNEPKYADSTGACRGAIFFCGSPEQLVELTKIASLALRKNDPRARLSSPGFTDGLRGVERLDQYLSAGASKYLDAISFHLYAGQPEEGWAIISALREVLKNMECQMCRCLIPRLAISFKMKTMM